MYNYYGPCPPRRVVKSAHVREPVYNLTEFARVVDISVATLHYWARKGEDFPAPVFQQKTVKYYRPSELHAWYAEYLKKQSTKTKESTC